LNLLMPALRIWTVTVRLTGILPLVLEDSIYNILIATMFPILYALVYIPVKQNFDSSLSFSARKTHECIYPQEEFLLLFNVA
jgi:hypothetical protein